MLFFQLVYKIHKLMNSCIYISEPFSVCGNLYSLNVSISYVNYIMEYAASKSASKMEPLEMKKDKGPYENNNVYDFIKI